FLFVFFFSSRRRHTRSDRDWSSDVCSSDLNTVKSRPWAALQLAWKAAQGRDLTVLVSLTLLLSAVTLLAEFLSSLVVAGPRTERSEERRVGKEWRCQRAGGR